MENKTPNIVKKISIENLMEALHELYHLGVEYVDIIGIQGKENDALTLRFSKEYMDEEFRDEFENFTFTDSGDPNLNIKLSDEDLNQLL